MIAFIRNICAWCFVIVIYIGWLPALAIACTFIFGVDEPTPQVTCVTTSRGNIVCGEKVP
jgi:hypothetical protein